MKKMKKYKRLIAKRKFLDVCRSAFWEAENDVGYKASKIQKSLIKDLDKKARKKLFKRVKKAIKKRLELNEG